MNEIIKALQEVHETLGLEYQERLKFARHCGEQGRYIDAHNWDQSSRGVLISQSRVQDKIDELEAMEAAYTDELEAQK